MCVSFRVGLGVALEAPRGLGEQFGCHGQVGLRAGEAGVAELGGEPGQPGLDINAFAVLGDEAADSDFTSVAFVHFACHGFSRPIHRLSVPGSVRRVRYIARIGVLLPDSGSYVFTGG